jgi:molybdenum cofactor cytidylyltransferase
LNAIVLAAGLSRRMKAQKLLLPFGGATVIGTVLRQVLGASFGGVIVVVSRDTEAVVRASRDGEPRLRVVVNDAPERGQSSSLRLGIGALPDGAPFCVALGDLPLATSAQFERYKKIFLDTAKGEAGHTALVPRRGDATGHPAFFSYAWAERLCDAQGDAGGRVALRAFSDEVLWTEGEDSFFADLDTPGEYREILHKTLAQG